MTNGLKLGIRAHDIAAASKEELVQKLMQYQLSTIQFAPKKSFPKIIRHWADLTPDVAREYGEFFQQQEIQLSVLGCYVNISSRDASVRQQAVAQFKNHLSLAKDFHARLVGTETGSVTQGYTTENFTEAAYQQARMSVIDMVTAAEELGVTVGIEAGLNHPIYTSQLAKRLIDEVQSRYLKIIFDPANLMRPDNYQEQTTVIARALDQLQDAIEVVHLKDFVVTNGQIHIVPVGQGLMDYTETLRFLKSKPQLPASLEATTETDLPLALKTIQRLYQSL